MRVAILASTFAAFAASPALAQCVVLTCPPPVQAHTYYQEPTYSEEVEAEEVLPPPQIHRPRPKAVHRVVPKRKVIRHAAAKAHVRRAKPRRVAVHTPPKRHRTHVAYTPRPYVDQIRDRAASYQAPAYGQTATLHSVSSYSSSSYSSSFRSERWEAPAQIVHQGSYSCGWGTRVLTDYSGQAHPQTVWVCACPEGWRPPNH